MQMIDVSERAILSNDCEIESLELEMVRINSLTTLHEFFYNLVESQMNIKKLPLLEESVMIEEN